MACNNIEGNGNCVDRNQGINSDAGNGRDAFAGKGLEYLAEASKARAVPAHSQSDRDVQWEDQRTADSLGHNLWLLAGVTSAPDMFAKDVLKDIATMPEDKLDKVADILEHGPHKAIVKRDASGKLESISYNYDYPNLKEVWDAGWVPTLIVGPEALTMKAGRALNRGTGNDVTLSFKDGTASVEASQFWDITGKGYWHGGSHRISAPIHRLPESQFKPSWMR